MARARAAAVILSMLAASCGGSDDGGESSASTTTTAAAATTGTTVPTPTTTLPASTSSTAPTTTRRSASPPAPATAPAPTTTAAPGRLVARFDSAGTAFQVTEVATGLRTVWALAWDPAGSLWYTERGGRLTRLGDRPQDVAGVEQSGEAGLMGLEIDDRGRRFVMYTGADDNRIVRLEADGSQKVLVSGIAKAVIHDGGRLRIGRDAMLYAATGDAGQPARAQDPGSLNGKVLRVDPEAGAATVFSSGHRNVQGLCNAPDGRLLATEHGPDRGDEINVLTPGFNGGWPDDVGNGIKNYTPTIAPAGCDVYTDDLIPSWKGSMLFVTLKGRSLHRLTFRSDGSVASDEVLLDGVFGRLRDVRTGPDGAVYLATSNRDGRGNPGAGDDRILRVAPAG
ncbi:MAG TPA: PQQ-dependent sugar dehydrogenase [Acidimicrobiales bacterium]|nr:PQQ-dependent sugar dehydrogenase [Acidimicrobiales bacterium]